MIKRCSWVGEDELLIHYHDHEWGVPVFDDRLLFEMFVLESFHCGLSWLIILKKRKAFKESFDHFDVNKVSNYNENKVLTLLENKEIVRHRSKIEATIMNAKAFIKVQEEFGSFSEYVWSFTNHKVQYNTMIQTSNELSNQFSKDLKKRGFKFMGTVTAYSYLEAIGVMNNHQTCCTYYNK